MGFDFAAAFVEGAELAGYGRRDPPVVMSVRTAGELELPSGAVVARDPDGPDTPGPFPVRFRPGRYPVLVALAADADGDERVALALLRTDEAAPAACTRWEPLRAEGEPEEGPWGPIEAGYPVDSGVGCFMSAEGDSVVRFEAGDGDGTYVTYAGRLEDGSAGALVTDFLVAAVPESDR